MEATSRQHIKFNIPTQVGTELTYIAEAFANERAAGDGPFTRKCIQLLDLLPRDKVILPSFTFVSTVNAFLLRGALRNDFYHHLGCSPGTVRCKRLGSQVLEGFRP